MDKKQTSLSTLILNCPGVLKANLLVQETFKETMVDFLLTETSLDGMDDDSWYYSRVSEHAYDEHGDIRYIYTNPQEQLNYERDHSTHLCWAREDVKQLFHKTIENNEDQIVMVLNGNVREIEVVATYPHQLVLPLKG